MYLVPWDEAEGMLMWKNSAQYRGWLMVALYKYLDLNIKAYMQNKIIQFHTHMHTVFPI